MFIHRRLPPGRRIVAVSATAARVGRPSFSPVHFYFQLQNGHAVNVLYLFWHCVCVCASVCFVSTRQQRMHILYMYTLLLFITIILGIIHVTEVVPRSVCSKQCIRIMLYYGVMVPDTVVNETTKNRDERPRLSRAGRVKRAANYFSAPAAAVGPSTAGR